MAIKTKEGASLLISLVATICVAVVMICLHAEWWVTVLVAVGVFAVIALFSLLMMYKYVAYKLKPIYSIVLSRDVHTTEILDELNREAIDTLTGYATEHTASIRLCLETAGIFRKLERAGDHINNLAEETIFYLDAEVLKHNKTLFLPEHTV